MRRFVGWGCGLAITLCGCGSATEAVDCTLVDPFPYAIVIDPISMASGARLTDSVAAIAADATSEHAFMTLVTGELASTVPSGTWDVTVEAEGFQPWFVADVETRPGICGGFDPVELEARLVPAP